nr:conserved phage C-terminal domain-containing protein [uncultured Leptotrichia sp.]
MKYTINGYSQEKLLKNNLDLSDSLILRVLADIYSSNGKKIEYKIMNNDKYMWISYGYLFEQIPIIGSERTLVRKIDSLIEKGMLKKELVTSKKGIKGRFLYISFGEKYFELTEYSNNAKEEIKIKETEERKDETENTKCQIGMNQMTKCHEPNDKLTSHQMTKCHNKDSSIDSTSINNNILNNIYSSVIDYLNEKTERTGKEKYSSTSPKTQTLIKARLREKYELEDFKIVIDKKCKEWLGTDMEKYLRPETLFGNKFESYLKQKTTTTKKPKFQKQNNDFAVTEEGLKKFYGCEWEE